MLNRTKLLHQIQSLSDTLFVSYANEYMIAQQVWQRIANDTTFIHEIAGANVPWPLPWWAGRLDSAIAVAPAEQYHIISVDGSQIYPDRHQGIGCFLINIGSVMIHYQATASSVVLDSVPEISMPDVRNDGPVSTEIVNCKRQERELQAGLHKALVYKQQAGQDLLLLFDGSLIFWSLAGQDATLKTIFFPRYCAVLLQLHEAHILYASYISLPKNQELTNLIRYALCEGDAKNSEAYSVVDHVVDSAIAHFFLTPYTRSVVFKSNVPLCQEYPTAIRPYFFYLHVGEEIARIEIPAWIAHDDELVNRVASRIVDQCMKGRGYPVVLAEAHEQAVIKGPDRDFFYHVLTKFGIEHKKQILLSQKNLKKRGIGI